MKNVLMYFYGFEPNDIHQTGKTYRFIMEGKTYLFFPVYRNLKEIEELDMLSKLFTSSISFHKIILNKQGKKITLVQKENYILLELRDDFQDSIGFMDILSFNNINIQTDSYKSLFRNDWYSLWTQKVDYFEYQVNQFGKKHPIIRESFGYFSGLAENAIQYTKNIFHNDNLCLSHHRIQENMKKLDFYNPLNIIIDYKVRDVAEYFKDRFFYGYLPFEEVEYVLEYQFNKEDYISFFARMLFPSFYFDVYEDILSHQKEEKELLTIIHKTEQYEELLRQIYAYISTKNRFLKPEWL